MLFGKRQKKIKDKDRIQELIDEIHTTRKMYWRSNAMTMTYLNEVQSLNRTVRKKNRRIEKLRARIGELYAIIDELKGSDDG